MVCSRPPHPPERVLQLATASLAGIGSSLAQLDDELKAQEEKMKELSRIFGTVEEETTGYNYIADPHEAISDLDDQATNKVEKDDEYRKLQEHVKALEETKFRQSYEPQKSTVGGMLNASLSFANCCCTTQQSVWDTMKAELTKTDVSDLLHAIMSHQHRKVVDRTVERAWNDCRGTNDFVARRTFRNWWINRKVMQ